MNAENPIIPLTETDDFESLESKPFLDTFVEDGANADKKKKKTYGYNNLNITTTMKRHRFAIPALDDPFEKGGWACSGCKSMIPHDDLVGEQKGDIFKVFGYHCQKCNYRFVHKKYEDEESRSGTKYMTMGKWDVLRNF